MAGGECLFRGKVKEDQVSLRCPTASNRSVAVLWGRLSPWNNGTLLSGSFRLSLGWPTFKLSADREYVLNELKRVAEFS